MADISYPLGSNELANSRMLPATITAIRGPQLFDVTVLGQAVANVASFYHCQHNVLTHASRVFKVGDAVICLHDGLLAPPSATNLKIIGFPDQVRRCLFGTFAVHPHQSGYYWPTPGQTPSQSALLGADETAWSAELTDLRYGNCEWLGVDTSGPGEPSTAPVVSWKGPAGRLIPFDRTTFYAGYSQTDEEVGATSYYTCFGPEIYRDGSVAATLPDYGTTNTKVLGAAVDSSGRLLAVVSCNFRDITNPAGGVGGFFELLVRQEPVAEPGNPLEAGGWKVLWYRQAGGPVEIWRFNETSDQAVNSSTRLTIGITATAADLPANAAGTRTYSQSGQQGDSWAVTETASGTFYRDYPADAAEIVTSWSGSQASTRSAVSENTSKTVAKKYSGTPAGIDFTISIGTSRNEDTNHLGFCIDQTTITPPVGCGSCTTVDSWSYSGFSGTACTVASGSRRLVTATRTIICGGISVTRTATKDLGPNQQTGMGWVLVSHTIILDSSVCPWCRPSVRDGMDCMTIQNYTTGTTLYRETLELMATGNNNGIQHNKVGIGCERGSTACTIPRTIPRNPGYSQAQNSCSGGYTYPSYAWSVIETRTYQWLCTSGVPAGNILNAPPPTT